MTPLIGSALALLPELRFWFRKIARDDHRRGTCHCQYAMEGLPADVFDFEKVRSGSFWRTTILPSIELLCPQITGPF